MVVQEKAHFYQHVTSWEGVHAKTTTMDQNVVVAVLDSTATQDVSNVLVIFEVQFMSFASQPQDSASVKDLSVV